MDYFEHVSTIIPVRPNADSCEDCLKIGGRWVHLRLCENCGHVGCSDNSPNRHATKHFHASGHAIIKSIQPSKSGDTAKSTMRFTTRCPNRRDRELISIQKNKENYIKWQLVQNGMKITTK